MPGGSGFVIEVKNGYIAGDRLAPPPFGPREFRAERNGLNDPDATSADGPVAGPPLVALASQADGGLSPITHSSKDSEARRRRVSQKTFSKEIRPPIPPRSRKGAKIMVANT